MPSPAGHLAMTPRERRKKIRLLQAESERLKSKGRAYDPGSEAAWDLAHAIRWALYYAARHVNLETGHLTIPLHEPEEVA